jgi:hypothetical protein
LGQRATRRFLPRSRRRRGAELAGHQHLGNGAGYEPAAVATFLQDADYYLVAHARARHHVVVTHEVVAHSTKKIKIPNACIGVGVRYVTPFEMLRAERARFVIVT